MKFKGKAFPPKSSVRHEAELDVSRIDSVALSVADEKLICDLNHIEISESMGHLPDRFVLPSGWVFIPEKTQELNQWLKQYGNTTFLSRLESKQKIWLSSLLLLIVLGLGSYHYILPWFSDSIAEAVPHKLTQKLGDITLQTLEESLQPSEISQEQQQQIRQRFKNQLTAFNVPLDNVEIFFYSSDFGANAFALPGGKIIILDDMINLMRTPEQLDSVIFHELGHVYHRHMLKGLVYSSLLSVGMALLTGDNAMLIDSMAAGGLFILMNRYTQEAEREADLFAKQAMLNIHAETKPMVEMFELLNQSTSSQMNYPQWLSSHPRLEDRIQASQ